MFDSIDVGSSLFAIYGYLDGPWNPLDSNAPKPTNQLNAISGIGAAVANGNYHCALLDNIYDNQNDYARMDPNDWSNGMLLNYFSNGSPAAINVALSPYIEYVACKFNFIYF